MDTREESRVMVIRSRSAYPIRVAAACLFAFNTAAWSALVPLAAPAGSESPVDGHLELGTRITHFGLNKPHDSGGFLGTIDELKAEQDYAPIKLYADWMFTPCLGVELTWDHLTAVADTKAADNHIDGQFVLAGPMLSAFVRYPNPSLLQPFAGLGAAYFATDFEADYWWAHGYASPASYNELGRPTGDRHGKSRSITTDDTMGFIATAGTDIKINPHWSADLYIRYTAAEVDAHYALLTKGRVTEDKGTHTIPFDNLAAGAGLKYVF